MRQAFQSLVRTVILIGVAAGTLLAERVVYPQAAVGPVGAQEFRIELRLGNRDPDRTWTGMIHFLRQADLSPMVDLRAEEPGEVPLLLAEGSWRVEIAADSSLLYRISSPLLQVGILVIEAEAGGSENIVPSFFYQLHDQAAQAATDLIAVQPSLSPGLAFTSMISQGGNMDVGVAIVAEPAIQTALTTGGKLSQVEIALTVFMEGGKKHSAVASLGGTEHGQKALFPSQIIAGLPASIESARLDIAASHPVYLTLLSVGTPPLFQDIQIGATPALLTSSSDGDGAGDLTGGWDLVTAPVSSTCGPVGDATGRRLLAVGCGRHFSVIMLDGLWGSGVVHGNDVVFAGFEVNEQDFGCPATLSSNGHGTIRDDRVEGHLRTAVSFDPDCGGVPDCILSSDIQMTRVDHVISCFERAVFPDQLSSEFILPYPAGASYRLNVSYCGVGWGHSNQLAYDFLMPVGVEVVAARSGIVRYIREDSPDDGQGTRHNNVQIQHEDGTVAFYAHLKQFSVLVAVGEEVKAGQRIALSGHSGTTDVSHLHFGVYQDYPPIEGQDVPVTFSNAVGPLDCRGGPVMGEDYLAAPESGFRVSEFRISK